MKCISPPLAPPGTLEAAPGPLPADVAAAVAAGLSKLFGGQSAAAAGATPAQQAGGGGSSGGAAAGAGAGAGQQQPLAVLTAMLAAAQSAKNLKAMQNKEGGPQGQGQQRDGEGGQQS